MMRKSVFISILPFICLQILIACLSVGYPFFWDNVLQSSIHAHFYYNSNFSELLLPDAIDPGHMPLMGMYLAMVWKLFGRSLLVSHLAVQPFITVAIWQFAVFAKHNFKRIPLFWLLLLPLTDATWLAQTTQVSVDILMLALTITAVNCLAARQKLRSTMLLMLLACCGLRGAVISLAIIIYYLCFVLHNQKKAWVVSFLVALLPALIYYGIHLWQKGWLTSYEGSAWSTQRGFVDFVGLIKNTVVFCWRMVDFGRLALYVVVLVLLIKQKKWVLTPKSLAIFIFIGVILFFAFVPFTNPICHRYLLVLYWAAALLLLSNLYLLVKPRFKTIVFFVFLIQLAGNFIPYPSSLAVGWDATLGHLPYHHLQQEAKDYCLENGVKVNEIGTQFPDLYAQKYHYINSDTSVMQAGIQNKPKFFIYSNVMNGLYPETAAQLHQKYQLKLTLSQWNVKVWVYKRKAF